MLKNLVRIQIEAPSIKLSPTMESPAEPHPEATNNRRISPIIGEQR